MTKVQNYVEGQKKCVVEHEDNIYSKMIPKQVTESVERDFRRGIVKVPNQIHKL